MDKYNVLDVFSWNYVNSDKKSIDQYTLEIDRETFNKLLPSQYSQTTLEENAVPCLIYRKPTDTDNKNLSAQFFLSKFEKNHFNPDDVTKYQTHEIQINDKNILENIENSIKEYNNYSSPYEDIVDKGIESIQTNGGSSDYALEKNYEASQNNILEEEETENKEYPFIIRKELDIPHPFLKRSIGKFYALETDPELLKKIYPDADKIKDGLNVFIEYTNTEYQEEIFNLNFYEKDRDIYKVAVNEDLISGYSLTDDFKELIKDYIYEVEQARVFEENEKNKEVITIDEIKEAKKEIFIDLYFKDIENPSFKSLDKIEKAAVIEDMSYSEDLHGNYNQEYNSDLYHTFSLPLSYIKKVIDEKDSNNNYRFDLNNASLARHYLEVVKEYKEEHNIIGKLSLSSINNFSEKCLNDKRNKPFFFGITHEGLRALKNDDEIIRQKILKNVDTLLDEKEISHNQKDCNLILDQMINTWYNTNHPTKTAEQPYYESKLEHLDSERIQGNNNILGYNEILGMWGLYNKKENVFAPYEDHESARKAYDSLEKEKTMYMTNNFIAENMYLQGDNARWAVVDWNKNYNQALLQRINSSGEKTDSYVIANNYTLSGTVKAPCITWGHGSYFESESKQYAQDVFECHKRGVGLATSVPEGWKKAEGVLTTPKGFIAITNGKSRFSDNENRKVMFIRKENYDRDMELSSLEQQKNFLKKANENFLSGINQCLPQTNVNKLNSILSDVPENKQKEFLEHTEKNCRNMIENTKNHINSNKNKR